jgi:nicotinate-nucleotide adenylyltransferase
MSPAAAAHARPLALLGGTFDPIHIAHLAVAWEAAELLDAEVRLMPASVPPHRPPPIADATTRVAMLRAALRNQDRIGLDTRELARGGPSYTIDTLEEMRAEEGDRPIVLLLGADAFAGLPGWHRWRALFEAAHLGVLSRPGAAREWPAELAEEVAARHVAAPRQLRDQPAGLVAELQVTPLDISATRIRDLLAAGREPRYLLPHGLFDDPALLAPYRQPSPQDRPS